MKNILIVEDHAAIVAMVRKALAREGFELTSMTDGLTGLAQIRRSPPDLLILDIELPKMSGLDICRELRRDRKLQHLPIVMLTGRGEETDRVLGLELGADDYVSKPFSPRELAARVKALLRRSAAVADESEKTLTVGELLIDPSSYRVVKAGKQVPVSVLEFRLLHHLAVRPNRVFTRDQLLDAVWGSERFVTPRSIDVYIQRLREKVEADPVKPRYLKTVRGAGYMFELEEGASEAVD